MAKIAVLYVGKGQENEFDIYKNEHGSSQYKEFVESLGWQVDLKTHTGYSGGIESTMSVNGKAYYYCDSSTEIIFHDVTNLITDRDDPKQLKKKRHIGNDHVHIIWNEHPRDYKFDTIGGDFGNCQIVVTPIINQLYVIDIYHDDGVSPFGPLQRYNVVTKEFLGTLVRNTAFNAYRMGHASNNNMPEHHPFSLRKENIDLISSRHRIQGDTFEKVLVSVFNGPNEEVKDEQHRQHLSG